MMCSRRTKTYFILKRTVHDLQQQVLQSEVAIQILLTALKCEMKPGEERRVEMQSGEQYAIIHDKKSRQLVFVPCLETMQ